MHEVTVRSMCSENVNLLSTVTPNTFIDVTLSTPGLSSGSIDLLFLKIISDVFDMFSFKLQLAAQAAWCCSSAGIEEELKAGTMR